MVWLLEKGVRAFAERNVARALGTVWQGRTRITTVFVGTSGYGADYETGAIQGVGLGAADVWLQA